MAYGAYRMAYGTYSMAYGAYGHRMAPVASRVGPLADGFYAHRIACDMAYAPMGLAHGLWAWNMAYGPRVWPMGL